MRPLSPCPLAAAVVRLLLVLLGVAARLPATAQAPAWQSARAVAVATAAGGTNYSEVRATAVDAAGNVFVAGNFTNTVVLGGTTLTSLGQRDVFVAKFNPATNQFVWAEQAGSAGYDSADALAVSGTSVYVAGNFDNPTASFGSTTLTTAGTQDVYVAKLTDTGDTGSFVWAQRAGGTGNDVALALAVSGASVYVAGAFNSLTAGFGPAALTNTGASIFDNDGFVAKLTDAGSTGSFVWAQRVGGTGNDVALALAVSGASVYVAGFFGGLTASFGPTVLTSAGSLDVFIAKLTDAGSTGSFVWAQRAGGASDDIATALAVSGSGVYAAGYFLSPTSAFGSATLTTAGYYDMFVAKLVDAGSTGSFVWAQRAGGAGDDRATAVAASGTGVYAAGYFDGPLAGFGPTTLTSAGGTDAFVAKLTDAGSSGSVAWARGAGGTANDKANAVAVGGTSLYLGGSFHSPTASFGPIALVNSHFAAGNSIGFLASLADPTLTATTAAAGPREPARLCPNPARHAVTLRLAAGTAPGPLTLTDARGRDVRRYPAPTSPEAVLDVHGLPAGLYLLLGAGPARRLAVE